LNRFYVQLIMSMSTP